LFKLLGCIFIENIRNNELSKNEINILKKKIWQELNYLKFDFSRVGTRQLSYCILLCIRHPGCITNLDKYCYSVLAKKYSVAPNTVKNNIFKVINDSYYKCEENLLKEYLNVNFLLKPTTKEIIVSICQYVFFQVIV